MSIIKVGHVTLEDPRKGQYHSGDVRSQSVSDITLSGIAISSSFFFVVGRRSPFILNLILLSLMA